MAEQVLQIAEQPPGHEQAEIAAALADLALLYENGGRYGEAVPLYERALAIREQASPTGGIETAKALSGLAGIYRKQGRYADAEPLYQRALAIRQAALAPDSAEIAQALNDLAVLYENQNRYADAEALYERSLAIAEKSPGSAQEDLASPLNNLAELYRLEGRYAEAEPLYKRALTIWEKAHGPDHPDVATALNNLAALYLQQGRYADAEEFGQHSLALREKVLGPDHPDVAEGLGNLALLYLKKGNYGEAERFYRRSLAIREKALGADHPDVAAALNNLAELYRTQGRYAEAEPLYKRSLAIKENARGSNHTDVALTLNNLALLEAEQGRYAEAEPLYKRSLAIYEQALGSDHPDAAIPLNNLADLYRVQERFAEAESLDKRSLAIREKALGHDHPDVALALENLTLLYHAQGRYADAERSYKEALAIYEKTVGLQHRDGAAALNNLATLYEDQGRYADAEPLFKRALEIRQNILDPDHPDVAQGLNNLAVLYQLMGRFADAEPLFRRSLTIYEKGLGPSHAAVANALNNLAWFYGDRKRSSEALPLVQTAMARGIAADWAALPVLFGAQRDKLIFADKAVDDSLNVAQRSQQTAAGAALNALAVRLSSGTDRLAELVREDQDLAAEASSLDNAIIAAISKESARRDPAAEQQIRARIAAVAGERDTIKNLFAREFPDYAALSQPEPMTVKDIQSLLAADEAFVVVYLGVKSYVWAITRDGAQWQELAVSAAEVSRSVTSLRNFVTAGRGRLFDAQASYALYRKILAPVEDALSEKSRLSIVLNGALSSLPPQLLIMRDPAGKALKDVDWLIRKHAVTVLPSVASLKVLRSKSPLASAEKPLIGFADPVFARDPRRLAQNTRLASYVTAARGIRGKVADIAELATALAPLPETADELKAVAASVRADAGDLMLGPDASETRVKQAKLDQYRIVYFATHGLLAGDVADFAKLNAEPALVLSLPEHPTEFDDGLLTASEVAQLKLNADWVVLSACNTASAERPGAEALSGLARAFFYAGGRSLLVSNWEVDSDSAVALMTGLFAALAAEPKLSHAEALQKSMLAMIGDAQHPQWADPRYWAPFVVVGEPAKPSN